MLPVHHCGFVLGIKGSPQLLFGKRAIRKWRFSTTECKDPQMDEGRVQKWVEKMDGWSDRGPYPGSVSGQAVDSSDFSLACVVVGFFFFSRSSTVKQSCFKEPHTYIHTVVMPPWMQGGLTSYVWRITTNPNKSMARRIVQVNLPKEFEHPFKL